jgi:hypothetical protein
MEFIVYFSFSSEIYQKCDIYRVLKKKKRRRMCSYDKDATTFNYLKINRDIIPEQKKVVKSEIKKLSVQS